MPELRSGVLRTACGCLALGTLLLAAATATHGAPPTRVEISYEVSRNGSAIADVQSRLEHDGRTYRIEEQWKGRGMLALRGEIRRSSRGTVTSSGLRPAGFSDDRGRDSTTARFDWEAKTLTLTHKGSTRTRVLGGPMQDRVSVIYQMAFVTPAARALAFEVTDGRDVSSQIYDIAGSEKVKTPAGEIDALHLVRRREQPDDRGVELWLDRGRSFLPVRLLVVEKDGTRVDQVASRISP